MATNLKFYTDATLDTELAIQDVNQLADGSSADVDGVVYLGSTESGSVFRADSDPGVDDIVVNIVDATSSSGVEDTDIKIALSSGGLDSAVAGDPVTIGTVINGGVANAVAIHYRSATPAISASDSDITFETNTIEETL